MHDLEGKFHRLELHHVLRDYNKAADMLAKTASSRKLVPEGFFLGDQHAPSVRAEGERLPEVEEPKVMAVDQPPELNLEDLDWRFPTRSRLDASRGEQRHSSSSRASSMSTINSCIKVHLDFQADKSLFVVKGPFFPRVVNPRY
jgi:hypothetical protein